MIHFIGSLLMLLSGAAVGFAASQELADRVRCTMDLCQLFKKLMIYLQSGIMDTGELFLRLSKDPELSGLTFLKRFADSGRFSDISSREIRKSELPVPEELLTKLSEYFRGFGRTDLEGELGRARLMLTELEFAEEKCAQKYMRCRRLYRVLGASAGAAMALIMG